jgi:hypothetical protein
LVCVVVGAQQSCPLSKLPLQIKIMFQ